ncbi:MAG: hypothetical protein IIU02_08835 [Treponema sp.]|uniref:hypothetical protein n=1 Tax=Treponema sp. TaxID=166 RepID=UPI00257B8CA4|nr:hypothetical protein [Treponema sp.]MBQ5537999.1 hypothetical protein [Treponema sp.]
MIEIISAYLFVFTSVSVLTKKCIPMLSVSGNALSSDELTSKAIGISEEYAAGRAR